MNKSFVEAKKTLRYLNKPHTIKEVAKVTGEDVEMVKKRVWNMSYNGRIRKVGEKNGEVLYQTVPKDKVVKPVARTVNGHATPSLDDGMSPDSLLMALEAVVVEVRHFVKKYQQAKKIASRL